MKKHASLISELKRRNVFRVAAAYIVVAWLVLQVIDVVGPIVGFPDWVAKAVLYTLLTGFPVTLVFSWIFEITPQGLKKEKEVDRSESISPVTGSKLDRVVMAVLAVAVGLLLFDKLVLQTDFSSDTHYENSVAVLPFSNRSSLEEDAFFSDGIHGDLLTYLSKINSLKVIARTSVMRFRDSDQSLAEIAGELNVKNILEGAIQRSGSKIRINVQLINAETEEHVWAEIFDRELTAENVFNIQSEIATSITTALRSTLTNEEAQRINRLPTQNTEAYEAYLRGIQNFDSRLNENLAIAESKFQQATELDPDFAHAHALLAMTYTLQYHYSGLPLEEASQKALASAARALELDPDLGEAYIARGGALHRMSRYEEAIEDYKRGVFLAPGFATGWHWYAQALGQIGKNKEALPLARRSAELNPLAPGSVGIQINMLMALGRHQEAIEQAKKVIRIAPDYSTAYDVIGDVYWFNLGRVDRALPWYRKSLEIDPTRNEIWAYSAFIYLDLGDVESAERQAREALKLAPHARWANWGMEWVRIAQGRDVEAQEHARVALDDDPIAREQRRHLRDHLIESGDIDAAVALYAGLPGQLLSPSEFSVGGESFRVAIDASKALFAAGDVDQANRLLAAAESIVMEYPRMGFTGHFIADAEIYALRGENDRALTAIELAVEQGWRMGWRVHLLHNDNLQSIVEEPRFRKVVAFLEKDMEEQLHSARNLPPASIDR